MSENSLPSRNPGIAHTPWLGVPPRMAWLTVLSPPPLSMKLRMALPPRELPTNTTWRAPVAWSTLSTSAFR